MAMSLGNIITQGQKAIITWVTNSVLFLDQDAIKNMSVEKKHIFSISVDYRPKKPNPNKVRIKVNGNLIEYLHQVTTQVVCNITNKAL